jgi:hypothetical protein
MAVHRGSNRPAGNAKRAVNSNSPAASPKYCVTPAAASIMPAPPYMPAMIKKESERHAGTASRRRRRNRRAAAGMNNAGIRNVPANDSNLANGKLTPASRNRSCSIA